MFDLSRLFPDVRYELINCFGMTPEFALQLTDQHAMLIIENAQREFKNIDSCARHTARLIVMQLLKEHQKGDR